MAGEEWPELPLASWAATCGTVHMWTQVVGKIRLALSPYLNHWWQTPLYVGARGLSTSPIPFQDRVFEIDFDFHDHNLAVRRSDGACRYVALYSRSVADFYQEVMAVLRAMNLDVKIWPMPVEVPDPIPFNEDETHASYDPAAVSRFHRILLLVDSVFKEFRGEFLGKASPVHFFWGSFDLAVTRFSGRLAPEREGADPITREAYSHECSSAGFWPGSGAVSDPAFYAYTSPEPQGYPGCKVRPAAAFYHPDMKEFILMYDHVRRAASPQGVLHEFLQSTYEAGANLGQWDRTALERPANRKPETSYGE
jgi:Family of unknown function (DUF5996)